MRKALLAAVAAFSCSTASALLIVDTGPADTAFGGASLNSRQSLAGTFTTTQAWTIQSVEAWIVLANAGDTGTVAIYSDESSAPGTELFSAEYTATGPRNGAWQGGTGLGWSLGAGTYWAAFEVRAGQTMSAAMSSNAPSPLAAYAFTDPVTDPRWFNIGASEAWGFRIDAEAPAGVPAPGALFLLSSGLIALGFARRRSPR